MSRYPRRKRYRRRSRQRNLVPLITAGIVAAGIVAGGSVLGFAKISQPQGHGSSAPAASANTKAAAHYLVSTVATAEESAYSLPDATRTELTNLGLAHGTLTTIRVSPRGTVTSDDIDLTPRSGGPNSDPLTIPDRANTAVAKKLDHLEATLNRAPSGSGSRSLYNGLLRSGFAPDADITIVSSGIDLMDPVDFRTLRWSTPASAVVARLRASDELASLPDARVTFVVVKPAGAQAQLRTPKELKYLKTLWSDLLKAGGAKSVRFIDANTARPTSKLVTPTVPLGSTTKTPTVSCTIGDSAFVADQPRLLDETTVRRSIADCTDAAAAAGASITVQAWTSYLPPLTSAQRSKDVTLSTARANVVAALITGVPRAAIHVVGHGDSHQPYATDPASARNRIARITITPAH